MKINKIKNQIGATAIEYALLAGLIAVATVTGVSATGASVSKTFCNVAGKIGKTGCLSAKDKMAQNSVLNNSELSLFVFQGLGLPAFSDDDLLNAIMTPDFSSLSISGLKSSDGSKISNANDLFNALGVSDVYKNYQDAMAEFNTAHANFQQVYYGQNSYASDEDVITAKTNANNERASALTKVNDAGSDLLNAMKSSTAKIETSGSQLSFKSSTASRNLNFVNFGNNSSNVSGKTSVSNVYTGQGILDVTTPASNYL